MNHHCKIHLHSWMEIFDLKIVLDEEKSIRYLEKYTSKAEKYSTGMSDIIQYLIPINRNAEQSERDNNNEVPVGGRADDISEPTIIHEVSLKYVDTHNKIQQEMFH